MQQGLAEGFQTSLRIGLPIHPADGNEGIVIRDKQKNYLFWRKREAELWLKYVLENPKYFSDPKELQEEIIKRCGQRYLAKGLNLHAFFDQGGSSRQNIHNFWLLENAGVTFQSSHNRRYISKLT